MVCLLRASKIGPKAFPTALSRKDISVLGHDAVTPSTLLVNGQYKNPSHNFTRLISYLQGFLGSLSREIARLPQGHLKNRLMPSCQW